MVALKDQIRLCDGCLAAELNRASDTILYDDG